MFPSGRHEQKVARLEGISVFAVLKNARSAYDDVDFILLMRLLRVVPEGPVDLGRHGAVAE